MRALLARYVALVLHYRFVVVSLIIVVTLLCAWKVAHLQASTSLAELVFETPEDFNAYRERVRKFGEDEVVIVGYSSDSPLSRASLGRLEAAVRRIEAHPEVARVTSILDAQRLRSQGDELQVDSFAELARAEPGAVPALTQELAAHPVYSKVLISKNGKYAATVIGLKVNPNRSLEVTAPLLADIKSSFLTEGFSADDLHLAGSPVLETELMQQAWSTLKRLLPYSAVALLVVVLLFFFSLSPVAIAAVVAALAAVWSLALASAIYGGLTAFMAIVPLMTLVIALTEVVHLFSAYDTLRGDGLAHSTAIIKAGADVGPGCVVTSVTTFIDFMCLTLVPSAVIRQVGVMLALGVVLALLLSLTLVPVALWWLPYRARKRTIGDRAMNQLLVRARVFALGKPRGILVVATALVAVSLVGIARANIDIDKAERLAQNNPVRADEEWFRRNLADTTVIDVFVEAPKGEKLTDPEFLRRLAEFQRQVQGLEGVEKFASFVDSIRILHRALGQTGELPQAPEAVAQYLFLFESAGGAPLAPLIDAEQRTMRMTARINAGTARGARTTGDEILRIGHETLGNDLHVQASGFAYLQGRFLDSVVTGQLQGFLWAVLTVVVLLAFQLRSVRVALCAAVPNLFPLLILGGWLGLTTRNIDPDVLLLAIIGFGLVIDDTTHFLTHYAVDVRAKGSSQQALESTYRFTGRGIVLSTLILSCGLFPLATSDYLSINIMGTLLPMTLLLALIADLFLVPALIQVGWLRFTPRPLPDSGVSAALDAIQIAGPSGLDTK